VPAPPDKAFRIFTEEIATWWPMESHSVEAMNTDSDQTGSLVFETGPNGRLYEVMSSGTEAHWANVTAWEPPHRLVLAWQVNPETPAPTEIEVRFTPEGDGTRVDFEHRGFEVLGQDAAESHSSYSSGWVTVFQDYVETIGK
jgi:uncharacterized protein YndB with AHSA1/START domain